MAENKDEQQIDDQKRAAAVAAELVWKAPDVGHADGRADRRENKAPAAGKMFGVFGVFHLIFALPCGRFPFPFLFLCTKAADERSDRFSTLHLFYCKSFKRESQGEPVFVHNDIKIAI